MSHVVIAQGHATTVLDRPLTAAAAGQVAAILHSSGIPVEPSTDSAGVVHLFPLRLLATVEEVVVLRAFRAVSDSPIAWHERLA